MSEVPPALAERARAIASALAAAGHRAWLVGGCVRDLALGLDPKDCDMATAATPGEIERIFERTAAVGRAFGTIVVHIAGGDAQVTTFRSERGYSDGRRPDEVAWGQTPEEDSRRRDFTCNALYLDPLNGELLDPQGGLADLERRVLRCVGDPAARFREDGLRIVRMARFAAANELEVESQTLQAASGSLDALAGVSPERVLAELTLIFERRRAWVALRLLGDSGALERALPGQAALRPSGVGEREAQDLRWRALEVLGVPPGAEIGLCVLLDPALGTGATPEAAIAGAADAVLGSLRPSRDLRRAVAGLQGLLAHIAAFARALAPSRAERIRVLRDPLWASAAKLARAWRTARGEPLEDVERLEQFASTLGNAGLWPEAWIAAGDLARAGIPRGPAWGALLGQAETLQLDLAWRSRDEALAWLAERARDALR